MDVRTLMAIAAETEEHEHLDPRAVEIYLWRFEQLSEAGYGDALAHQLAENTEVDLHTACSLLSRGCPEPTAFAILS